MVRLLLREILMVRRLLVAVIAAAALSAGFAATASAAPTTRQAEGLGVNLGVTLGGHEDDQNVNGLINLGALHG